MSAKDRLQHVFMLYREGLNSVTSSQVLVPMVAMSKLDHQVHAGIMTPVGQFMRPGSRRRWSDITFDLPDDVIQRVSRIAAPPTRWPKLWSEYAALRSWYRKRFAMGKRVVLRCRGVVMSSMAIKLRDELHGLRVVFDCRGVEPEEVMVMTECEGRSHHEELVKLQAYVLKEADGISFVSNAMRDYFIERHQCSDRPNMVMPCCVQTDQYDDAYQQRIQKRRTLNLSDRFIVTYSGSMYPWQCPEDCVRVFKIIKAHEPMAFFMALTTDTGPMLSVVRQAGLADEDILIKSCRPSEVPSYLALADAGLLLREQSVINHVASPVKCAEYLAAGVPVILADGIGDYSDKIVRGNLGVICDPAASDEEVWRSVTPLVEAWRSGDQGYGERSRRIAQEDLSWSVHIPKLVAFHESLAK